MDADTDLDVAVLGNVSTDVPYSTENEYLDAYERAGHRALGFQEGSHIVMRKLIDGIRRGDFDFVHWTRTKSLADNVGNELQWEMLRTAGRCGVPVIGVHLDIWISLPREEQIVTDPYFRGVDLLMTADGGHQNEWADFNVNHQWLLPAISERWLGLGTPRDEYRSKIAFVGNWRGQYHPEAEHRHQLVKWLGNIYGDDVQFWPKRGRHAIRGRELNDLYASVDVVVGDSYLSPGGRYSSDRIPETAGRGGYLLHPYVEGVNLEEADPFYYLTDPWEAGDWEMLRRKIDERLADAEPLPDSEYEQSIRAVGVNEVSTRHTYTHRVAEIVDAVKEMS